MNIFKFLIGVLAEFWVNSLNYFKGFSLLDRDFFKDWSLWEKMWLTVATVAIIVASVWTWDPTNTIPSWAALISSLTGIWCVILVAKGKISNYLFGLVNVVVYAYAAYSWQLYGDFMLNAFYFLPMQFYGWYVWTKPGYKRGKDNVVVRFLSNRNRFAWALVCIGAIVGYGAILRWMGGLTPFFDSTSTVLSIIAMILMARLFMEQWILWIIVDVVTVLMWANIVFLEGGMFNMGILVMWIAFLINAVYGFAKWIRMKREQDREAVVS